MVVSSPVVSLSDTGSQVVPLGQVTSLQHTSTQMFRVFSQRLLLHSELAVHAAPETRTAVERTHADSTETMPPASVGARSVSAAEWQAPFPRGSLQ